MADQGQQPNPQDPAFLLQAINGLIQQNNVLTQSLHNAGQNLNAAQQELAQTRQELQAFIAQQNAAVNAAPQQQPVQNAAAANAAAAAQPATITDFHSSGQAYDLAQRVGLAAFTTASRPLDYQYDGSNINYPYFINALKQRARECYWITGATGIVTITRAAAGGANAVTLNLFDQINAITEPELEAAWNTYGDRQKQNAKAMHQCIIGAFTGDLQTNFMNQDNLPIEQNGPLLFKLVADYTTIHSTESAAQANIELTNFDPADHKFNIIKVNQELNNLFLRYGQSSFGSNMDDNFKLFYVLNAYKKIQQPRQWINFAEDRDRQATARPPTLTNPRILMTEGVIKYNELKQFTGEFEASKADLSENLVAMRADLEKEKATVAAIAKELKKKAAPASSRKRDSETQDEGNPTGKKPPPPFAKHTKASARNGGEPYKEGDTKMWNGTKFYFHPATSHQNGRHWYKHPVPGCTTCKKWKENQDGNEDSSEAAPSASAISDLTSEQELASIEPSVLLAHAYNNLNGREHMQCQIADMLNELEDS